MPGRWRSSEERQIEVLGYCIEAGARCLAGGSAFFACLVASQALQGALRISTGTPLGIPSLIGLATVCGASAAAVGVSEAAGSFLTTGDARKVLSLPQAQAAPENLEALAGVGAFGVAAFRALGGRFHSIAPSRLDSLGSFAHSPFSLRATLNYATAQEKVALSKLGEVFGCHSCGGRRGPFHADHMPPVKVVAAANARLWRRMLRATVSQRFYPQCKACSELQSSAVRNASGAFVYHFRALRPYHATGALVVLATVLLAKHCDSQAKAVRKQK
ncbi:unnamed protein product [Phaeothamnion confervicola]